MLILQKEIECAKIYVLNIHIASCGLISKSIRNAEKQPSSDWAVM